MQQIRSFKVHCFVQSRSTDFFFFFLSMKSYVMSTNQECLIDEYPKHMFFVVVFFFLFFFCVEVLWPSQPNGVMSSAVSLPNHTFTGQA